MRRNFVRFNVCPDGKRMNKGLVRKEARGLPYSIGKRELALLGRARILAKDPKPGTTALVWNLASNPDGMAHRIRPATLTAQGSSDVDS